MVAYEVGDNVANPFSGIRGPDWRKVLMLDHSSALNVHHEILFKSVWRLCIT
jgi:hypothetical protein